MAQDGTGIGIVNNLNAHFLSRIYTKRLVFFLLLAVILLGSGCGGEDPPDITPATIGGDGILFDRGEAALAEENWGDARGFFVQVRDNYPQSDFRADARLGVADSYEGQGGASQYTSALAEYEDFLRLYPTHPRAAYAQFKLAIVHHHQMRQPERDQSWTLSAIAQFELFLERFPNSELAPEATNYLREARDRLADSEYLVGEYYYRNEWWPGAIDRFKTISESDPQYTRRESVYFYLADAYFNNGDLQDALPVFQQLLREFPQSVFLVDIQMAIADIENRLASQTESGSESGADSVQAEPQSPR